MDRRLLAVVLAAAAAGCADNRVTVEIVGRAAPSDATSCKYSPTGEFAAGPGALDVAGTPVTYDQVLYVKNNAADPVTSSPNASTSAKAWRALAAKVRVNPSDYVGDFAPSTLLGVTGTNIMPLDGMTTAPGANAAQFASLIGAPLGAQLQAALGAGTRAQVVLGVTLQGETLDGARVDTGEWFMAVDVCNGCFAALACVAPKVATFGCNGAFQDPVPTCK